MRVSIGGTDLLTLDVHASVVGRIDDAPLADDSSADDGDEAIEGAGPIALAIDLGDGEAGTAEARGRRRPRAPADAAATGAAPPHVPA